MAESGSEGQVVSRYVRSNGCKAPIYRSRGNAEYWCMKCGDLLVRHPVKQDGRAWHKIYKADEYSEVLRIMEP